MVPCARECWTYCRKAICPKGSTNLPNNRSNPIADILAIQTMYKPVIILTALMLVCLVLMEVCNYRYC